MRNSLGGNHQSEQRDNAKWRRYPMSNDDLDPEAEWRVYLAKHIASGTLDEAIQLVIRRLREQLSRAITAVNLLEARNPDLDATAKELLTITKTSHADMAAFITTQLVDVLLPRVRQAASQHLDTDAPEQQSGSTESSLCAAD
jgi:hypothetical protein